MQKLIVLFLFLAACSCAGKTTFEVPPLRDCGAAILFDDEPTVAEKYWVEQAQRQFAKAFDPGSAQVCGGVVKVHRLKDREAVNKVCPFEQRVIACSLNNFNAGNYTIYFPANEPHVLRHEMLHVLMWQQGTAIDHHLLMRMHGWY